MNHLTREYVTKLKDSLLFINAVVIIYNASLFLLSTKYISVHYYARDFSFYHYCFINEIKRKR